MLLLDVLGWCCDDVFVLFQRQNPDNSVTCHHGYVFICLVSVPSLSYCTVLFKALEVMFDSLLLLDVSGVG